jgi:hypothetical protein
MQGSVGYCLFFFIVTGCASPAKPTAMIPNSFDVKNTHPYLVSVEVGGGKETNPLLNMN